MQAYSSLYHEYVLCIYSLSSHTEVEKMLCKSHMLSKLTLTWLNGAELPNFGTTRVKESEAL